MITKMLLLFLISALGTDVTDVEPVKGYADSKTVGIDEKALKERAVAFVDRWMERPDTSARILTTT